MADDITNRTSDLESTLDALQKRKDPDEGRIPQARPMPQFVGKVTRRATSPAFPTAKTAEVTQATSEVSGGGADFTFALEGSVKESDHFTADVLIHDGEVNGETPAGMGTDEYSLDVNFDGAFINLIVTYDPDTHDITSMTFEVNSEVPDSSLGLLYIEIGRVYLDFDPDTGEISNVTTLNTQCGDINFELVYGALNGAPALLPVAVYGTWVPVPSGP